jgi:hypothetical protein
MGMDVYGLNPKENKKLKEFVTLSKYRDMDYKKKWKALDSDEELREKYWAEEDAYREINVGTYFRNNVWSWRPLWDFCHQFTDVVSRHDWENGHHNDGHIIEEGKAKQLGIQLIELLDDGVVDEYIKEYTLEMEERKKNGDEFATSYILWRENVEDFARFCLECGGFEIS